MKFFVLVLVVFTVAGPLSTQCVSAQANPSPNGYGYPAPAPAGLDTLLASTVNDLISSILLYLQNLVLFLVPPSTPVPLPTLLQTLVAAQPLSLGILLEAVFSLVGIPASPVLAACPSVLTTLPIDVNNLAGALLAAVPPNTPSVPFAILFNFLATYLQQLLFNLVISILGAVSNLWFHSKQTILTANFPRIVS